jgi:hypothetical protein
MRRPETKKRERMGKEREKVRENGSALADLPEFVF